MACQILLDFSPRSTLTLGDSCGPEAPMGRTQTGAVRRRRWTPRARTGCLTCRNRRVNVQRHNVNIETEPPDWDFQQGIRYYFEIVVPGRSAEWL
ncbi:hypothetical protein LMH87_007393 [Akanthomyces muscarius]|uniref:Uncharacterized protein n=1 Tax=Akanthomyces muscarius TaxID=2231603 RepID=A0A9W8UTR1_AKAMU|nr:hypothetical protein LMH87_007393 [Akanthomyces muscarius]KAJ4165775.1 hypothetical protein LMH87_007393 [Akanthomyces muscarius]